MLFSLMARRELIRNFYIFFLRKEYECCEMGEFNEAEIMSRLVNINPIIAEE